MSSSESTDSTPIGYLVDRVIYCAACAKSHRVPVYAVNILPYSQHCAYCNAVLVQGTVALDLFQRGS